MNSEEANASGPLSPVHPANSLSDITSIQFNLNHFHNVLSANYNHFSFATGAPISNMTERNFEKCKVIQQGTNENR